MRDVLTFSKAAGIVGHIHREMALHINYCEGFGMTKAEIEACEENQGDFPFPVLPTLLTDAK
jgi:hypothetical protein